ncbi:hypothetical protein FB451DRAFT_1497702 [Mycena latifolia]|nr:hypothetical protein FB451DRAFT_1497702 [Mycena latifolia]
MSTSPDDLTPALPSKVSAVNSFLYTWRETGDPDAEDALAKWTLFLQEYAKGNERAPPPPLRSTNPGTSAKPKELPSFEVLLYPPGEISRETARTIAEFYDEHGFLPPPRADEESVGLQTIQEYNLFREDQAENFHRSASLVNIFFDFAPVCTISLFDHDVQVFVSKSGDFPVKLGEGLVTETSICGHVVLKKNGETTELSEVTGDWRFAANLWAGVSNGVKGYVGVPITLEVDPSNPLDSERVTVGVLALMSSRTLPAFTVTQRKVLNHLCTMLSVQLRSTWEGLRRGTEARLRNAVSLFLEAEHQGDGQYCGDDGTPCARLRLWKKHTEKVWSTPAQSSIFRANAPASDKRPLAAIEPLDGRWPTFKDENPVDQMDSRQLWFSNIRRP